MCLTCDWKDVARRAKEVADQLPTWKTHSIEFYLDLAQSIEDMGHATPRQTEVVEEGEEQVENEDA